MTELIEPTLLLPKQAKVYRVGGCVRDYLLGRPSMDVDYVIVGATAQAMLDAGFRQVGADFPVFLHPETLDEYALARTERKSGHGYNGFTVYASPEVTLEEDLSRRDFTINAMAMSEDGTVIDPFGGKEHLAKRILKHVGDAFVEDPLRVLRGARFAAKYDLSIHPDTQEVMARLLQSGEMAHLVPERVRVELEKAAPAHRRTMWQILDQGGFLEKIIPPEMARPSVYQILDHVALWQEHTKGQPEGLNEFVAMWGALMHKATCDREGDLVKHWVQRYRLPAESAYVANTLTLLQQLPPQPSAEEMLSFWNKTDARRRAAAWAAVMQFAQALNTSSVGYETWLEVDKSCRLINEKEVVDSCKLLTGNLKALPAMLDKERLTKVQGALLHGYSAEICTKQLTP